jgi:hypothetical protein
MPLHAFGDESTSSKYLLAAALVEARDLDALRATMRSLRVRGARRNHFNNENDRQRKKVICGLRDMAAGILVIDATAAAAPRDAALECLVDHLAKAGAQRLVLERDDSVAAADKKTIRDRCIIAGCAGTLSYELMRAHEDALLEIPDAIAWCLQRGGQWALRVRPFISETITL